MSGTDYADHTLRVESDTGPKEVHEFVDRRTKNPLKYKGITVFNYSTHEINYEALDERIPDLYRDEYMIPFQLGPVWAYMITLLPIRIREIEYLRYDAADDEYHPHNNFIRVSEFHDDTVKRKELARFCANDLDQRIEDDSYDEKIHGVKNA